MSLTYAAFASESLARTGNIQSTREDIGRRIGELFVNRFYINLHTDILDTPGKLSPTDPVTI